LTISAAARDFTKWSPAGSYLAVLGHDERLRVWDAVRRKQIAPPLHERGTFQHEAFSADGKRLILVDTDHMVRLWDLSPCTKEGRHGEESVGIQPGMKEDFSHTRLTTLVQALAGASIDQEERLTPLRGPELLAAWRRFQNGE
jgi:WD40 repeat protein